MLKEVKRIALQHLCSNQGQIPGLPANPRLIKNEAYRKLVDSIKQNPEMLDLRELIVYRDCEFDDEYVVIAGNMRLAALRELNYDSALCKVLDEQCTVEQLKAYTIKDNVGYGEWDYELLANEWNAVELQEWGVEIPVHFDAEIEDYEVKQKMSTLFRLTIETENKANFEIIKKELDRLKIGYVESEK